MPAEVPQRSMHRLYRIPIASAMRGAAVFDRQGVPGFPIQTERRAARYLLWRHAAIILCRITQSAVRIALAEQEVSLTVKKQKHRNPGSHLLPAAVWPFPSGVRKSRFPAADLTAKRCPAPEDPFFSFCCGQARSIAAAASPGLDRETAYGCP